MGLFWDYFRKTLRWPQILVPGALAMLAEGGAACLDATRDVILQLRDQAFPSRCETVNLDRFAASRGIVRSPLEPDDHWYGRIRFAYLWWVRGGRESAMQESMRFGFGFTSCEVINLRAEDPLRWASFRLVLEGVQGDIMTSLDAVTWAVNEVKPARSKLDSMQLYAVAEPSSLQRGIATIGGHATVIYPYTVPEITVTFGPCRGAVCQMGIATTIYPAT